MSRFVNDGPPKRGGFRVYVGDIGKQIFREDLQKEFGQYGPVIDVYMGRRTDP